MRSGKLHRGAVPVPQDGPTCPGPSSGGARRRRRAGPLVLALTLALGLAAFTASAANAEAHSEATFTCSSVTYTFEGFPNAPNNTVTEKVFVDGVLATTAKFSFNGPTGSNTVKVTVPPGHHSMDAFAKWKTNGVKGSRDQPLPNGITCGPERGMSVGKKQTIEFSGKKFTTSPLPLGKPGQTVDYQITVTNTGNVPLTITNFTDPKCDNGTIEGGPGTKELQFGESTVFTCKHLLTVADREVGFYTNTATVTGTPPEGDGEPITENSNTVIVELPDPDNTATFSCTSVTFNFTGFPNVEENVVLERIFLDHSLIFEGIFKFSGPTATNTVPISVPPGHHSIDAFTKWNKDGFKGSNDIPAKNGITC
jgi:hypothetical protein